MDAHQERHGSLRTNKHARKYAQPPTTATTAAAAGRARPAEERRREKGGRGGQGRKGKKRRLKISNSIHARNISSAGYCLKYMDNSQSTFKRWIETGCFSAQNIGCATSHQCRQGKQARLSQTRTCPCDGFEREEFGRVPHRYKITTRPCHHDKQTTSPSPQIDKIQTH